MREDKLIEWIEDWFKLAVPNPTTENQCVQIGCHLEEFSEMLECLNPDGQAWKETFELADKFKKSDLWSIDATYIVADIDSYALQMRDALCDQIVTAIGIYHMMGWDIHEDLRAVCESNWSKFENDKPVFDENGKIKKGKDYFPPRFLSQRCAENPKPVGHPHAKSMKIYADDAIRTRRPWELWEYKNKYAKSWISCDSSPLWLETLDYRHKQKMIKVGNFEFPEPVREINAYNEFDTIYFLSFNGDCFSVNKTVSHKYEWEELIVKGGFVHLTLEAAEKHAEVLSKICKGEV